MKSYFGKSIYFQRSVNFREKREGTLRSLFQEGLRRGLPAAEGREPGQGSRTGATGQRSGLLYRLGSLYIYAHSG